MDMMKKIPSPKMSPGKEAPTTKDEMKKEIEKLEELASEIEKEKDELIGKMDKSVE